MQFGVTPAVPWHRQALDRIRAHFWLKLVGTTVFIWAFFLGYLWTLKNPLFPVFAMPTTAIDEAVAFIPESIFAYGTLWLYVSLPHGLLTTRPALYRYCAAIAIVCLIGLACFLLWPTAAPANRHLWALHPDLDFLEGIDAAGNACPSLHVATAVFSGIWLHHQLRSVGAPLPLVAFNVVWGTAIALSTLTTKQHVFLDAAAGGLLGALGAFVSLAIHAREERHHAASLPISPSPVLRRAVR